MRIQSFAPRTRNRLATFGILALGLLAVTAPQAGAEESNELVWREPAPAEQHPLVRVLSAGQKLNSERECFVITHGMGGTSAGDSFHSLAAAIRKSFPRASVIRLDWSEKASARIGGFPNPWKVAESIDAVGDEAAQVLKREGIDPARATFIGESFGNWVNARVASQLGGVCGILALNPANELGGYAPPNLGKFAQRSWSFHTYSPFDTTREIAESDFFLETTAGATPENQHVAGIRWLTARVAAGDLSWLSMEKTLPQRRDGCFRATATMDGQLADTQPPRERPIPKQELQGTLDVAAVMN